MADRPESMPFWRTVLLLLVPACAFQPHEVRETRDEEGRVVKREVDRYRDGSIDEWTDFTYDDRGRCVTEDFHKRRDGSWCRTYTYLGDGSLEVTELRTYESGGRRRDVRTYDRHGDLLRESSDWGDDGSPELIRQRVYDDCGRLVRESVDHTGVGAIDELRVNAYDIHGRVVSERLNDRTRRYTYNDRGDVVESLLEDGKTGKVTRTVFGYRYDERGRIVRKDFDRGGDGVVEFRIESTFDDRGRRLTRTEDGSLHVPGHPADGTIDRRCTYAPPCPPRRAHCRERCEDFGWRRKQIQRHPEEFFIRKH